MIQLTGSPYLRGQKRCQRVTKFRSRSRGCVVQTFTRQASMTHASSVARGSIDTQEASLSDMCQQLQSLVRSSLAFQDLSAPDFTHGDTKWYEKQELPTWDRQLQASRCLTGEPSCMVLMVSMCHPPSTGVRMVLVRSLLDAIAPSADTPRNTVKHPAAMASQQASCCAAAINPRLRSCHVFCRLPELQRTVPPTT